jgi:hypothetical protein
MSVCELASVIFAMIDLWWLIVIVVGLSSSARLELRSNPAYLERDFTQLTRNLRRKINY